MRNLLELPPLKGMEGAPCGASHESEAALHRRLRTAVERLSSSLRDDAAAALANTLGTLREDRLEAFARRVAARSGNGGATPAMLYACAAEALAEGEIGPASVGLVALLDEPSTWHAALLGLAICAARADRPDEALAMALSSRSGEAGHPRALTVAGVAEHLRGHAMQARLYLALASRLARREAEYASDLRLAQRLLLSMQMA